MSAFRYAVCMQKFNSKQPPSGRSWDKHPPRSGKAAKPHSPRHAPSPAHHKGSTELDFGIILVYEDESIIVVDKPAGILSVATPKESDKTVFKVVRDYLSYGTWQQRRGKAIADSRESGAYLGVVHRLDRDTSGIMFFVKNPQARELLTHNWQAKVSDRRYLAIVNGVPAQTEGTIHNWLRQNKALRVYSIPTAEKGAEEAITHYKLVRTIESSSHGGTLSLLELRLETGRTNQIRVHMADLHCPIIGDRKYGESVHKGRLALHARRIVFEHPEDGRQMVFESPLPPELKRLLRF
jgi:23S rRNA pseudouridine1911/1915/1917 synthase